MTISVPTSAEARIMGVINLTPDSFSDGGSFLHAQRAFEHACQLVEEGAEIIDCGAESTRPGASPVGDEEEWQRLGPFLECWQKNPPKAMLSVDTKKPLLMRRLPTFGVKIINCVSGLTGIDGETLKSLASAEMTFIAMHGGNDPRTMQDEPLSGEAAVKKVQAFFDEASTKLTRAGFSAERIWLDPGIGFGKDDAANLKLLASTKRFAKTRTLVVGVSRKSFLGRLLEIPEPKNRDDVSKILELCLFHSGAQVIRTHEVRRLARLRETWLETEAFSNSTTTMH